MTIDPNQTFQSLQSPSARNGFFRLGTPTQADKPNYQDAINSITRGEHFLLPQFAAGTAVLPQYTSTLMKLTKHPTQLEDSIMSSYTESPYAKYQEQNLDQQEANQAAASGQLGTPDEQIDLAKQDQGIVSKDQQQYYDDAMRPFQMGLSGEQYLTGMGARAGEGIAQQQDQIGNVFDREQAEEDAQKALEDKEKASTFSSLLGAGAGVAGDLALGGVL